jgi:hypothetical protein
LVRQGGGTPLEVNETDGSEPAEIGPLIREWPAEPGVGLATRLHAVGGVDHFWLERLGWFRIDSRAPSMDIPILPPGFGSQIWRESVMWGTPAAVCAVRRGLISIHAAAVDVGGVALLLAGPGTFGKTTLGGAFLLAGHRLLSDDIVCCEMSPEPAVLPGPAILRLRRDVSARLDFSAVATPHELGRKVGLVIKASHRGDASPVPLGGIILLRRSSGEITLTPVVPAHAIRDLFALSFKGVLDQRRSFEDLTALVSAVPVWNLERPLEFENLPHVVDRIVMTCLQRADT